MDEQQNSEYEKLKAEINQIRSDYSKAKKILDDVNNLSEKFTKLKDTLTNPEDGIQTNYDKVKKQKEEIDVFITNARSQTDEISANLQKVKGNIESMQSAFIEFTEIKGKIAGVSGEIETLLSTSRGLRQDIENIKKEAQSTLDGIKNTYQEIAANIKAMQDAYQEFLQIKGKIEDEESGFQALHDLVQSIYKQSNTLFAEIQTMRDSSKSLLDDIDKNKKQSDKLRNEMQANFDFTAEQKERIETATGLIIDTSFAETFKRRQVEIEKGLYSWYSWKYIFFASILLLVILVILPFTGWLDFGTIKWYELFLNRIYYTSPVLFLIGFSAVQYSKERDLAEKYAFKAASSAAIRSHVDYLTEKFKGIKNEKQEEILKFTTDTFSTIYREPYTTHDKLEERIKKLEEKTKDNFPEKMDINNLVSSIKELKELLPEASLFEKIINIFFKK